jgi:FAD/FMN-containing dehydrogenase
MLTSPGRPSEYRIGQRTHVLSHVGSPATSGDSISDVTGGTAMTAPILEPRSVGSAWSDLETGFGGELAGPTHQDYEEHRKVWNGSIDRRPAVIARCAGAQDISRAVGFARRTGMPLAVRGGGHSFPGLSVCDDGIVVDLGLMRDIHVDLDEGTARVSAGALLGELDQATQPYGLAAPTGIVTHTGVAGLTLGGGLGWLMRRYGLSIDQLLSVDLVTADGDHVHTSETDDPELFWGVRGGGGNFGIATDFEFRLNPVGPTVLAGMIVWPIEASRDVLHFYRDWVADAPDELMTIVVHRKAPALAFIPTELRGRLIVGVAICWVGQQEQGEEFLRPLRGFGAPILDLCRARPYLEHQSMFDPSFPHGWWYYLRACDVAELNDDIIDITVEHSSRIRSPRTAFPIWQLGGAMARVGDDATAFHGRGAGFTFNISGITESEDGFDAERRWVRDFWTALEPHHTSVYVNFLMDEGEDRIRQAYGPAKYDRLKRLKTRYDPDNLFRLNQNIPPH